MVAITVVLAATAFVLVADVGEQTTKPGLQVGLVHDDFNDRLEVTDAGQDADWRRVSLVVDDGGPVGTAYVGNGAGIINEPAGTDGFPLLDGRNDIMTSSLAMVGGDVLFFCRDGGGTGTFEVAIMDEDSNAVASGTFKFGDLGACP